MQSNRAAKQSAGRTIRALLSRASPLAAGRDFCARSAVVRLGGITSFSQPQETNTAIKDLPSLV
jgi:hypothetical protein